jgi:hypothetical protein
MHYYKASDELILPAFCLYGGENQVFDTYRHYTGGS